MLRPDFRVIDAGANMGHLTLKFAKNCPLGQVFSFEPDSDNFTSLCENVNLNHLDNIQLFQTALSDKSGKAQLYKLFPNNPGANRILSNEPDIPTASEMVRVSTIDEFFKQNIFGSIDLIKIDVEGFELFVIKGAAELIKKCKPTLFVELSAINLMQQNCKPSDLIDYIQNLNYHVLNAKDMKAIDKFFDGHQTDIICISKENVDTSNTL
jgi:FkbM family methyltransferase